MTRAILGALLLALIPGTLAACSSDDGADDGASAPTETVTVTTDPETEPLTLSSASERTTACFLDESPADVAWFDISWKANVDIDRFSFELTGAEGVTQVGLAETVPPVNFGGRIDVGGDAAWEGHRRWLSRDRSVDGSRLGSADFWTPIAGETGLLVLHLRFDPVVLGAEEGGGFDGVRATYTTVDGVEGEVTVDAPHVIRAGDCRA